VAKVKQRGHDVQVTPAGSKGRSRPTGVGWIAVCRCQWHGPVRPARLEAVEDAAGHREWVAIPRAERREMRRRDTPEST
jgi:hypothetical protein